ncbi:MAG TPA: ABC transporter ATP-binding protein [Dehalococcoidia bacterium]|nr:ABC transporter ATP-binding protein [Dehalococcoidia bacterium]
MASASPSTTATAIIEAIDLHKTYRADGNEVHALRGVDLVVQRGEMVSIMGPSGCGKTTLLNCLSGLDDVDSGVVRIEGQEIQTLSDNAKTEYRARRMGFVFQFYNLLPVLSSVENVELPLLLSGVSASDSRRRAIEALDLVQLTDWADHRPAQLSGGQRQRVTIARALANNPAIVWADEPTGDLDSVNANEIMALIENLNADNQQTFVIVTHDQGIGDRCHRTVLMRDGRIEGEVQHRPFNATPPPLADSAG